MQQNGLISDVVEIMRDIARKNPAPTSMWVQYDSGFVACMSLGYDNGFAAGRFGSLAEVLDWQERIMGKHGKD